MTTPPNILFLFDDEHRYDTFGFAGNDVVRTPFLDDLASRACIFENAYTPSPVCIPSRQAMATGKLPREINCERYGQDIQPFSQTFARLFAEHGYHTTACGKLHHPGPDQMQGWTKRVAGDLEIYDPFIDFKQDPAAYNQADLSTAIDHCPGSSKWNDVKEIKRAGIGRGHSHDEDDFIIDGTKNYIRAKYLNSHYDRTTPNRPVLLYVGLNNPHYPYLAEEELFEYYLTRVKPFLNQKAADHPWLGCSASKLGEDRGPVTVGPTGHVSEREMQRATAAYYANCEKVDRQFDDVARTLEFVNQNLDDWLIVYSTDHGEMLGEHEIWEKKQFFEGAARVPLLIKLPGQQEQKIITENVNLCDLFATLTDVCNLPTPDGLYSRSLCGLMNGESDDWDNETISQLHGRFLMIKRDHLKYQYYEDMPQVLFDLEIDPTETRDFSNDPAYAQAMQDFRVRAKQLGFG